VSNIFYAHDFPVSSSHHRHNAVFDLCTTDTISCVALSIMVLRI